MRTSDKTPCPRCHQTAYDRKVMLDIQGTPLTVCNVCAPETVEVPVELKDTDDMLISTGTFKVMLDWRRENVVVDTVQQWRERSAWRRVKDWVFGSTRASVGVE